jgi:1-acyl-sn-glycerol-3-phosphate acyltransferase
MVDAQGGMRLMQTQSAWSRRLLSVSGLALVFVLLTLLSPVLCAAALLFDVVRWLGKQKSATSRMLAMLWFYLGAELVGVLSLIWVWFAAGVGAKRSERLLQKTAFVQQAWTASLLWFVQKLYRAPLSVEGEENIQPGPLLVLIRHSSLVDTLLPVVLLSKRHQILMRYVLKRELLWDPCLDIAGNRLPNYFVDRQSENREEEFAGIATLAKDLTANDGVLIYPEGTRFSPKKLAKIQEKLAGTPEGDWAQRYHCLLPPKIGGVSALLDANPGADVLLMAHHGLEKVSHWRSVWQGELVGQTISVKLWRIARAEIPAEREARKLWLHEQWLALDEWLLSKGS